MGSAGGEGEGEATGEDADAATAGGAVGGPLCRERQTAGAHLTATVRLTCPPKRRIFHFWYYEREAREKSQEKEEEEKKNGTTSTHNAKNVGREPFTTVLFPSFCVVQ